MCHNHAPSHPPVITRAHETRHSREMRFHAIEVVEEIEAFMRRRPGVQRSAGVGGRYCTQGDRRGEETMYHSESARYAREGSFEGTGREERGRASQRDGRWPLH